MSGLPRFCGRNAGSPARPWFVHVRCAIRASGARPDLPQAARSFISPNPGRQKLSSLTTQEALAFGYIARPKPFPKVLLPSTRRPSVTKYLELTSNTFWKKNPEFQTFSRSSKPSVEEDELTVGSAAPGKPSPNALTVASKSPTA